MCLNCKLFAWAKGFVFPHVPEIHPKSQGTPSRRGAVFCLYCYSEISLMSEIKVSDFKGNFSVNLSPGNVIIRLFKVYNRTSDVPFISWYILKLLKDVLLMVPPQWQRKSNFISESVWDGQCRGDSFVSQVQPHLVPVEALQGSEKGRSVC